MKPLLIHKPRMVHVQDLVLADEVVTQLMRAYLLFRAEHAAAAAAQYLPSADADAMLHFLTRHLDGPVTAAAIAFLEWAGYEVRLTAAGMRLKDQIRPSFEIV